MRRIRNIKHTQDGAQAYWERVGITVKLERMPEQTEAYTLGVRRKPNYLMPALLQDSQSDLALRWSNWLDADRLAGHKY